MLQHGGLTRPLAGKAPRTAMASVQSRSRAMRANDANKKSRGRGSGWPRSSFKGRGERRRPPFAARRSGRCIGMAALPQRVFGARVHARGGAVLVIAGTRPECIKLAPVVHALGAA